MQTNNPEYDYYFKLETGNDYSEGNDYMKYTINKDGLIHGKCITGDCCDSKETLYNYINGKKEGISYEYYKNTNIIISESQYKSDKLNGKYIEYYIDISSIKIEYYYCDDKRNGDYIEYYKNGNIKIKTKYKRGALYGKYIKYYENGSKKIECYYEDNIINGLYNEWDLNGNIIKNVLY
jgi:antitoxin component YwqK of YwqJK toxin-antitoxin module